PHPGYELTIALLASALYTDDHIGEALALAQAAAAGTGGGGELRGSALGTLALVRLRAGDGPPGQAAAPQAFEDPDAAERPNGYVAACAVLAMLEARRGRPYVARTHADRALEACERYELGATPSGAPAFLADALVATLEGRLHQAESAAARAV